MRSGPRQSATVEPLRRSWQRADAVRTGTLWLLVASAFLASIGTGGIAFHTAAYFTDVNVCAGARRRRGERDGALRGVRQWHLGRAWRSAFSPRGLNVMTMVVAAASVALLMQVDRLPRHIFLRCSSASTRAARRCSTQILIARYFGRRSFGAISSVLDPFHKGGLGLGALFAGSAFDYFGNYRLIFMIFLVSYLCSALMVFLARQPDVSNRRDLGAKRAGSDLCATVDYLDFLRVIL